MNLFLLVGAMAMLSLHCCEGGSKKKPHNHQGILKPYDGKHIPYSISLENNNLLQKGQAVIINERNGKDGRGIVIQDVHARPEICMDRIRDLPNYHKMVKNVKKVSIYDSHSYSNGTEISNAEFNVGLALLSFTYFLKLKYDPAYFTLTWTLDYQFDSDFDDNTGHWQVVEHPSKPGWSRVLYSCEVKVFNWLPEFVITMLTKTALIESTAWVKRESEKLANSVTNDLSPYTLGDVSACFIVDTNELTAKYSTHCAETKANLYKSNLAHSEL